MTFGDHGVDFLLSPGAHETSISLIKEVQKSDIRMILHNGDISYAMGYVSISHVFKIPFTVLHNKLYLLLVKTQGSSIFTNDRACYVTWQWIKIFSFQIFCSPSIGISLKCALELSIHIMKLKILKRVKFLLTAVNFIIRVF